MTAERAPLDITSVRARLGSDVVPRLELVDSAGSTNSELAAAASADPDAWPDFSIYLAEHQAAGRGRAGRGWETPPGAALTVSFVLRPRVPSATFGWVGLLGALAVVRAVGAFGLVARAKWPNDVLVDAPRDAQEIDGWGRGRKVAGILGEVAAEAVVLGIGVNVLQEAAELPVPWAGSLASLGATVGERAREDLLVVLAHQLWQLDERWRAAGGDAAAAGLVEEYAAVSATLGRAVAVERPGGEVVAGVAQGVADDGGLLVLRADGEREVVRAGDVHHLRVPGV
ncbi:MAG: biotin--[acetyl-CoA-carboxylase] ligase [Actinomycetota bacterium]|nr:biotin--[acetyl-CoA-carboxylase] ligase [Actinomycetota bacterium]